ncbi:MAG: isoleucine--tRNA ligase [Verrucomicrobia bacterium]|nr:isoleucine--tRNA ligase [Verrucomicrobiota bacterium]
MANDLKHTLSLPKTDFPMRGDLPKREPLRLAQWEKLSLYTAIQQKRTAENAPAFVLHDGPPFTNGDVHIGTALNKSLKDITLRYKSLRGFRTPYVPGWDCHGLPIEQKVTKELQAAGTILPTAELRSRCDVFAEGWIKKQTASFKRLGVQADWAREYKTKAPAFEADILRTFAAFVEQGLVYRSKKPVYWSIPFETALAEAEIEYAEHTSIAIWVKFLVPAAEAQTFGLPGDKPLSIVIWTTTPWTIPANIAIAVHPETDYVVADLGTERILVAKALLPSIADTLKLPATPEVVHTLAGAALEKLAARHPFINRASPVVLADYVTTDSGTGCVHTAPGHGAEDYLTGLKYQLPIYCPVGDDGRYLDDGQVPADLVGITCLETVEDLATKKPSPANLAVLKKLAAPDPVTGHVALLAKAKYVHSYPHCWRSKTPIIFRAVDQWFVSLDKAGHRAKALAAIQGVTWFPAWGQSRITGAVESRPDWCISRQRSWGVPIIAFYDARKVAYLDAGVVRAVAAKIAAHPAGTNLWYELSAAELLSGIELPAGWPAPAELVCGRDTLDVWIDSGSSHAAVLRNGQGGTSWPADLYLEGSDQHRGWFQSSLWTGVIAQGGAPYKAVLTHGFIVGEDGKKISKSGSYEKPPTSDNFINDYGADVIRLWLASQDFTQDITLSKKILDNAAEQYRGFRNALRYQLSILHDFECDKHALPHAQLDVLDRWALHQAARFLADATAAYDAYEFHRVVSLCAHFVATTLSSVYNDVCKDRLYTYAVNHTQRRSTQTAVHAIHGILVRVLAPILTFTADEAWCHARFKADFAPDGAPTPCVHLADWPVAAPDWRDDALATDFAELLKVRAKVNEELEPMRQAGKLGKSLDAAVTLTVSSADPLAAVLQRHAEFLPELFIVSQVSVQVGDNPALELNAQPCADLGYVRCPRCWRWVPALQSTPHGDVCPRCAEAFVP